MHSQEDYLPPQARQARLCLGTQRRKLLRSFRKLLRSLLPLPALAVESRWLLVCCIRKGVVALSDDARIMIALLPPGLQPALELEAVLFDLSDADLQ